MSPAKKGQPIADRLSNRADEMAYGDVRAPKTSELLYEAAVKLRVLVKAAKAMLAEYGTGDRECEDDLKEAIRAVEEKS